VAGLIFLDAFAVFALLVLAAVVVDLTLLLAAAAVGADVRPLAVTVLTALVAVGYRVDALVIVIARLIVQGAVAVAGAVAAAVGDGKALIAPRGASEAGVAFIVIIAALAAGAGFDAKLGRGPFERDTPEDRGQSAAREATDCLSSRRLRGTQGLCELVKSSFVHERFPSDSHTWE
jgi:hypothetical protein